MTLLELLDQAAREIDCPVSDLCTAEDPCTRRPMARALRDARERLANEIERRNKALDASIARGHLSETHGEGATQRRIIETLLLINGGPDPAPRGPQPESPKSPDPVELLREVHAEHPQPEICRACIFLGRAASRRDTP